MLQPVVAIIRLRQLSCYKSYIYIYIHIIYNSYSKKVVKT